MSSYAVVWSEPRSEAETGKLEFLPADLRFEGARVRRVPYREIEGVRVAYGAAERLYGRPALVLDLAAGGSLRIGSVDGVGTVSELADELTRLSAR
jgi:hypothetical protein